MGEQSERKGQQVLDGNICDVCKTGNPEFAKFCCVCGMSLNEETDRYDAFISYRRDGGSETARLVKVLIENTVDKKLFLDVDGLSTGLFDESLLSIIRNSENFILILSPGCLDRCGNEDDWLKKEISHAIRHDRNIIPVMKEGFSFPRDRDLPRDIRKLPRYNAVPYNHKFIDATIRDILRFMRDKSANAPNSAQQTDKVLKYHLRSKSVSVSGEDARKIFKLNEEWRPLEYVRNDFEDNGDGTITDHATGLMWQRAGSDNHMIYAEARYYADRLNHQGFAGYRNWRLPTIEELLSLTEPQKTSDGLCIAPIFDRKIKCLSSDERLFSQWVFCVYFYDGAVGWNDISSYARLVRSCR